MVVHITSFHVHVFIRTIQVSYWVASEICSISDPRARGALIEKFVEVAKVCCSNVHDCTHTYIIIMC